MQLDVRERDQESWPDEDVELGRVQPPDGLVVEREVEDDEEVLRVLVDLRPLALREDVLDVELVEAEALGEDRGLLRVGVGEDPGEAVAESSRMRGSGRAATSPGPGASPPNAGPGRRPCHGYLGGLPVASPKYVI